MPQLNNLGYLSGLIGGFEPFALTREARLKRGDARVSIEERYAGRQDYLDRTKQAAEVLVRDRFMLAEDIRSVVQRAGDIWDAVVSLPPR